MTPPNNRTGRPRRRPFAAHNARAVVTRAENAIRWLEELRWRLGSEKEVEGHLRAVRTADLVWFYTNGQVMENVIARLVASLADPIAPDEGQSDG